MKKRKSMKRRRIYTGRKKRNNQGKRSMGKEGKKTKTIIRLSELHTCIH